MAESASTEESGKCRLCRAPARGLPTQPLQSGLDDHVAARASDAGQAFSGDKLYARRLGVGHPPGGQHHAALAAATGAAAGFELYARLFSEFKQRTFGAGPAQSLRRALELHLAWHRAGGPAESLHARRAEGFVVDML